MNVTTRTRKHNIFLVGIVLFVALAVAVIVLVTPDQKNTTAQTTTVPNVGLVLPIVQLEGQWFSHDNDVVFTATVTGQIIEIQSSFSGETSALYWNGSFKSAESPGATITSNKIDLPDEIILSQSASKDFQINRDSMTFEFSAMGFKKKVTLTR